MSRSAKAATNAREVSGEGGTGLGRGITNEISQSPRTPRAVVVQQQRGLARSGGTLERRPTYTHDRATTREGGKRLGQSGRACDRVKLVVPVGESRRGVHVIVGAKRHYQVVGLVDPPIGCYTTSLRIDRGDRLLNEAHPRLDDVAIGKPDRVKRGSTEQHVELGVTEDERIALVDQGHFDPLAKCLREDRHQLKTPEPGSQYDYSSLHRASVYAIEAGSDQPPNSSATPRKTDICWARASPV
jgi:hypothetical protein